MSILDAIEDKTFYAISMGKVEKWILETNDLDGLGEKNFTALMWACSNGHCEIVKMLIEYGADVNKQNTKGDAPIRISVRDSNSEITKILLEAGAKDERSDQYISLMSRAVDNNDLETVIILLDHGIYGDELDIDDLTPLMRSVINDNPKIVKLLLLNGADRYKENSGGNTAIDFIDEYQEECAKLLRGE